MRSLICLVLLGLGVRAEACAWRESEVVVTGQATDALAAERAAFLVEELKAAGLGAEPASETCRFELRLQTLAAQPDDQAFTLVREGARVTITGRTSLATLYGAYEVLEKLGVRYLAPQSIVTPATLHWARIPERFSLAPLMPQRGFWVFGEDRDPAFLLWAGRNRFNVVGGAFADGGRLRRIFGMRSWGGGHDIFPLLTPTDRPVDGVMLAAAHPAWFAGGGQKAIPTGAETYANPCFGAPGYAVFFAQRLEQALLDGSLAEVDIINVWPSDSPALALPRACTRAPGSSSDADDLIHFYSVVSKSIAESPALMAKGRKPVIAGIGYEGTYDLAAARFKLPGAPYQHIFYQSLRTYRDGFHDPKSPLNVQLAAGLRATAARHELPQHGIVEYHNFSLFAGMFVPDIALLRRDIAAYRMGGAALYAYMHPTQMPSLAEQALNRALARITFGDDSDTALWADFRDTALDGSSEALAALEAYSRTLATRSELFGAEMALHLVAYSDHIWSPPPLSKAQIATILEAYQAGRAQQMTPLRAAWVKPITVEVPALPAVIAALAEGATGSPGNPMPRPTIFLRGGR